MTRRPLLAHRQGAGALIALAVAGTVLLGVHYEGTRRAGRLDVAIDGRVRHHLRGHLVILRRLVDFADPSSVIVICAVLVLVFLAGRRFRLAVLSVLGPATAGLLVDSVLKPLFDRRLDGALSFPSGHTAGAVSVAIVIAVAMLGASAPPWPLLVRVGASGAALIGAGLIAAALVGAGYHYATDTLGGLCVAVASVLTMALVIDAIAGPRAPAQHSRKHAPRPDDAKLPTVGV